MTKDVLITISGIQMIDEEDSDVEMIVRGRLLSEEWKALHPLRRDDGRLYR